MSFNSTQPYPCHFFDRIKTDEEGAIKHLEERMAKAPNFSVDMLRSKVFGAFKDDEEFKLVHFAMLPLYSENYNADSGLRTCLSTVYVAESHS